MAKRHLNILPDISPCHTSLDGLSPLKSLQMCRLNWSVRRILGLLYSFPGMITIAERDVLIIQRFEEDELIADIAVDFDISPQRVWQIVRGKNKR